MMSDTVENQAALSYMIDSYLLSAADYTLTIDRDSEDHYAFSFEDRGTSSSYHLEKEQAMQIVPTGSQWSYFLGFRDIFGIPFPAEDPKWIAFGFETALKHGTRGAYLYLKALFLPLPLSSKAIGGIDKIANSIYSFNNYSVIKPLNRIEFNVRGKTKLEFSRREALSYTPVESWIIRKAVSKYENEEPFLFRTMAMKKSQISNLRGARITSTLKCMTQNKGFIT